MDNKEVSVFCPNCGFKFNYFEHFRGRVAGGVGGAATGAILGAKVGIAMGPLGAIAGTLPGAFLGSVFGKNIGKNIDSPICPSCKTQFELPSKLKKNIIDLMANSTVESSTAELPKDINDWVSNKMYFELAKYLIKNEKRGESVKAKKILRAIRNKDSALARKIDKVMKDLKNRM